MRALGPRTQKKYERALAHAFTAPALLQGLQDTSAWANGSKAILRAAIRWRAEELGVAYEPLTRTVRPSYAVQTRVRAPTEDEATAYEAVCMELRPGDRALALLLIRMGLRADELLGLRRQDVRRAVKTGELVVLRKGGKEHILPADHVIPLLEELLEVPRKRPRRIAAEAHPAGAWERAGEVISAGSEKTQYNILWRLVRDAGIRAGRGLRPHLLRHAFATRMNRDGAPLATIGAALGHSKLTTTARYVSPSAEDIRRYVRR